MNHDELPTLLARLDPMLHAADYVFCCLEGARYGDFDHLDPVAAIAEREGLTLVVERRTADGHGLPYSGVFRRITLQVPSSLEAVGLTAAVSASLADNGISCNLLAGFHHDHLYVPERVAAKALEILEHLQSKAGNS